VDRRHPALLATLDETYVEVLDELIQLLGQALAGADSRGRPELSQRIVDRASAEADRGRLLDEMLDVLADRAISHDQAGRLIRQRIGMPRLIAARRPVQEREPRDHGHFDLLAARYKYLRTFTPTVIAALPLTGNTASPDAAALLNAVGVLRELNSAGRTTIPDEAMSPAAASFVPARWCGYLDAARGQGRGAAYRHYWELSVLYAVQARLRAGDVWVTGSRRYTDPATLLIPPDLWISQRDDFCAVTGADPDPRRQLARLEAELHSAVADLERVLAHPSTEGLARLGEDGDLIVSPLPPEQLPADAAAAATAARLPRVHLPGLLIEVDRARPPSRAAPPGGRPRKRRGNLHKATGCSSPDGCASPTTKPKTARSASDELDVDGIGASLRYATSQLTGSSATAAHQRRGATAAVTPVGRGRRTSPPPNGGGRPGPQMPHCHGTKPSVAAGSAACIASRPHSKRGAI